MNHKITGNVKEAWLDVAEQLKWKRVAANSIDDTEICVAISAVGVVSVGASDGKKRKLGDMLKCSAPGGKTLLQFNTFMQNEGA